MCAHNDREDDPRLSALPPPPRLPPLPDRETVAFNQGCLVGTVLGGLLVLAAVAIARLVIWGIVR